MYHFNNCFIMTFLHIDSYFCNYFCKHASPVIIYIINRFSVVSLKAVFVSILFILVSDLKNKQPYCLTFHSKTHSTQHIFHTVTPRDTVGTGKRFIFHCHLLDMHKKKLLGFLCDLAILAWSDGHTSIKYTFMGGLMLVLLRRDIREAAISSVDCGA